MLEYANFSKITTLNLRFDMDVFNSCSFSQIKRLEVKIIKFLGDDVSFPTHLTFLEFFLGAMSEFSESDLHWVCPAVVVFFCVNLTHLNISFIGNFFSLETLLSTFLNWVSLMRHCVNTLLVCVVLQCCICCGLS